MGWLFASFYFVPAAIGSLGFWAVWRLTRLIELELTTRRLFFAFLGALVFAPMLVPVAAIYGAWVPHFLLLPSPDVGYYIRFARPVAMSLVVTAVVFWVVARLFVSPTTLKFRWTTIAPPILALVLVAGSYLYEFPSSDIDRRVDPIALEVAYGERLDQVIALLNIDDDAQRQSEIARLHTAFGADPSVLRVRVQDSRSHFPYRGVFEHLNVDSPPSESCSSTGPYQLILMRCTWSYRGSSRRQVLKYKRSFSRADASLEVVLDLDYKKALGVVDRDAPK
jgi:hypothetical protein